MQGHLTVVLDLDGTLVSSYTPARAPRLPPGMNTYIVGKGARMNPNGVFVVERPGLSHFFQQLSSFAGMHSLTNMRLRTFASSAIVFKLNKCLLLQRLCCSQRAWRIMRPQSQTGFS